MAKWEHHSVTLSPRAESLLNRAKDQLQSTIYPGRQVSCSRVLEWLLNLYDHVGDCVPPILSSDEYDILEEMVRRRERRNRKNKAEQKEVGVS